MKSGEYMGNTICIHIYINKNTYVYMYIYICIYVYVCMYNTIIGLRYFRHLLGFYGNIHGNYCGRNPAAVGNHW